MNADAFSDLHADIHVASTLPKPWEEELTFNDLLYDWMQRAPWLALSVAAHLLAYFVFAAIPWSTFDEPDVVVLEAELAQAPEEEFLEEEELEPEEALEEEPIEEPFLQDAESSDHDETEDELETAESEGDPDMNSDSPFDSFDLNAELGIGGSAGGKLGNRFGGGRDLGTTGGSGTEPYLRDGLEWLAIHQDDDGKWDADEFMKHDPANDPCDGPGHSTQDVGVTGLALLAFLGDGNTTNEGPYKNVVAAGIKWLRDQQDPDTGLFGEAASHDFLYGHAIATLAVSESYYFSKSPLIKGTAQSAINTIVRARNPYGAWRYDVPPIGDNDTSVTGWMVFALASAKEAGLKVDEAALEGALAWIEEVTDPATGRTGYDSFGSLSSRTPANEHYPREKGESMTAVALLSRFFLGQDPSNVDVMQKQADLLQRTPPEWDTDLGSDMYYWYYGTYAMFQMGGNHWKTWNIAMKKAVLDSQRRDGSSKGSWDPIGPWGYSGGRVYSTAMMTLCLEVYFRYGKVLGSR